MRLITGMLLVGIGLAAVGCAGNSQRQSTAMGSKKPTTQMGAPNMEAVEAQGNVRLKDWAPESSLVVPRTAVPKARFVAIDVHSHVYGVDTPEKVAERVRMMDAVGLETIVVLTGVTGKKFDQLVEAYKAYPGRFQLYCGVLTEGIDRPDYPQRAAAELERCHRIGARGIGELSEKGWGYARETVVPRDQRLHGDDPRLDLFWAKALELKMPANIHMADHPSAWRPPDAHQERPPKFQTFNQYGKDSPSYEEVLQIRDRLLERHPKNTFIAAHLSNEGNDLAALTKVMDRFPNLIVDISARQYELGRQPRSAVKFLTKYKDRILWGTDQGISPDMYRRWWQFLESPDEYMPSASWWMIYGLELPEPMLKALYRDNAKRILNWE